MKNSMNKKLPSQFGANVETTEGADHAHDAYDTYKGHRPSHHKLNAEKDKQSRERQAAIKQAYQQKIPLFKPSNEPARPSRAQNSSAWRKFIQDELSDFEEATGMKASR